MRNLNVHHLTYSLNKLCDCLDHLYFINSGGCCYIASQIAMHLDRLGIEYKLIVYDEFPRNSFGINYEVTNMSKSKQKSHSVTGRSTCCHYCIYINGGGQINAGDISGLRKYTIHDVSYKNLKWIYKNGSWNNYYNTDNNKIIRGIINSFFKEYE